MRCRCFLSAILLLTFLCCPAASAQEHANPILRLDGIMPGGVRGTATESWGLCDFKLTNLSDNDRLARLVVFFPDRQDTQYGRDVWVPAHSALSSWMLIGPAPKLKPEQLCEIRMHLYDRSEGKEQLILPPGEERIRSGTLFHRSREPSTVILLDESASEEEVWGQLPQPESRQEEAIRLTRGFRLTRNLSEYVHPISSHLLPPVAEALDGIDHFVLASDRIAQDPAGMQALRHWLERGGKVWVMLDMVSPDALGPLLGDAVDFQVVDRVGLTSFRVRQQAAGQVVALEPPVQHHDRPVQFVRVLLPNQEQARFNIDDWPVWFTRRMGRGTVVFSTLGARGWFRERERRDPKSPFPNFRAFPMPTPPLIDLGFELHHRQDSPPFPIGAFEPMLTKEIGYSVAGRGIVVLVFTVFLLAVLALGIGLRRSRRPELLGWLVPAAALATAGVFVVIGEASRRSAPPTVAVAQVVDAVSGKEEASIHGLMAVYRPDSGAAELAATRGGFIDWNVERMEGQTRRMVLTDLDAWHWENLALPAGVRLAPFQSSVWTGKPISAIARFGPAGIEGRLQAEPFEELSDLLLTAPGGRNLAVQLRPDGTFQAGSADVLPSGQFLAGAVLNDRQQQRQELYREFLKPPGVDYLQDRNILFAWARPIDSGFQVLSEARSAGSALLVVPVHFERPAAAERVTIPGPLLTYRRITGGLPTRPVTTSNQGIDMHLRFQLPLEVLPFQLERARLLAKINAPARRVTISAQDGDKFAEIYRTDSPFDPMRLNIDERFLHLDQEGGLHLNVKVGDSTRDDPRQGGLEQVNWTIEYLEIEVSGHMKNPERGA
jgi:hypothetical protein